MIDLGLKTKFYEMFARLMIIDDICIEFIEHPLNSESG